MTIHQMIECPFIIAVDTREHVHPYQFKGLKANAREFYYPGREIEVPIEWKALRTGDYSIAGYEDRIAIERKTLGDFYNSIGQNRDRFERECDRLAEMERGVVIIEASWQQIIKEPPKHSRLKPIVAYRTILSWLVKKGIHFLTMEDRRLAEMTTFRLLEKFWHDQQKQH